MLELGVVSSPGLRCALSPPARQFKNRLSANGQSSKVYLWSCGVQAAMLSLAVLERSETCGWVCRKELLKEMLPLSFLSCSGWITPICNDDVTASNSAWQALAGNNQSNFPVALGKFWPRLVMAPGCTKFLYSKLDEMISTSTLVNEVCPDGMCKAQQIQISWVPFIVLGLFSCGISLTRATKTCFFNFCK